jgi:hypothetical protein
MFNRSYRKITAAAGGAVLAAAAALALGAGPASATTCDGTITGGICQSVTGSTAVYGTFSLSLDKTTFATGGGIPGQAATTGAMPGSPALTATVVDNTDARGYLLQFFVTDGNLADGFGSGSWTSGSHTFPEVNNTSFWGPSGWTQVTGNDGIVAQTGGLSNPAGDAIPQGFQVTPPAGTPTGTYAGNFAYMLTGN